MQKEILGIKKIVQSKREREDDPVSKRICGEIAEGDPLHQKGSTEEKQGQKNISQVQKESLWIITLLRRKMQKEPLLMSIDKTATSPPLRTRSKKLWMKQRR